MGLYPSGTMTLERRFKIWMIYLNQGHWRQRPAYFVRRSIKLALASSQEAPTRPSKYVRIHFRAHLFVNVDCRYMQNSRNDMYYTCMLYYRRPFLGCVRCLIDIRWIDRCLANVRLR